MATVGLWAQEASVLPAWPSPGRCRVLLNVDMRGRLRSHSPAAVEIDFQRALTRLNVPGKFDEFTIEVQSLEATARSGAGPRRVPHRLDKYYGASRLTLHFVVLNHACSNYAVYFDTVESGQGRPSRYAGLVGDGDCFCEGFKEREITASHFDQFYDFDGDGDLDLFKGGVEPFVYCYENVGGNRLVARGRLTSGGELFVLPHSQDAHRSWVTVAFHDWDGDGAPDFFPSFGDGPDRGQIIFYRNTTHEQGGQLTFQRVGPLQTVSGVPVAGGAQAGGWFPSITFVPDWDGDQDGRTDVLAGSNHRSWLYRNLGPDERGFPRLADAVPVTAAGTNIILVNPRFDSADIDGDGDLDLFAGTQPGPVYWFKNIGSRTRPVFAPGIVIGLGGHYLIGDAHSGIKVADFDGDHLLDFVAGRFWERADLADPARPRDFGGFHRNIGTRTAPRFARRSKNSPTTKQFQICDAIRQNCVRARDWDQDGKKDLLAGDTDGYIWFFRNEADAFFSTFAAGEKLRAGGQWLNRAATGGHARFDVCDWNNDGKHDLIVADGQGTVSLFLNIGSAKRPILAAGRSLQAGGKPIQIGGRASVLVCDWNNDGSKDLILADEKGYYYLKNVGTDREPVLATAKPITFNGKPAGYVRPNLGAFIDWDGDGKKDFIGCHFENSIRLYRNLGPGVANTEPQFSHPDGELLLQSWTVQMISGAEVVDWNGDGGLDILTGQGHGGSGLRFFARDYLEDELHHTHPRVTIQAMERQSSK